MCSQSFKKNECKPWQHKQWCIGKIDSEYVYRMENLLDLYEEEYDERFPVICLDEKPVQLISETRSPIPAKPGRCKRVDYEYRRNGSCNLFVAIEPLRGWRRIKSTERRTKQDFAEFLKELVEDPAYSCAHKIRIVLDNLNTHKESSLYKRFDPETARKILRRVEFHYTPKHGSWLNMAEVEISVLQTQCLRRYIPSQEFLEREVKVWEAARNARNATIAWNFTVAKARDKMAKSYLSILN
jgi:hypothetical protein